MSRIPIFNINSDILILFFQATQRKKWTLGERALFQTNLLDLKWGPSKESHKEYTTDTTKPIEDAPDHTELLASTWFRWGAKDKKVANLISLTNTQAYKDFLYSKFQSFGMDFLS